MSKNYYIIPIFVPHEGCPHNCVFCNQNRITGKSDEVTAETVYSIADEYLKTINKKNATIEISFFGGTFTAIKEEKQRELLKVAKEYKEKGLIDKIRMSTRPDYINDYILSYLKEYLVDIIELGVQSLDNEVLKASGRGHSSSQVLEASKLIKSYGITLGHQIMPGLPKDTFEKDIETVKKSIEMKPDIVRLYPSLVIKDTPMEDMYMAGTYKPYTLMEAVEICEKLDRLYEAHNIKVIRMGLQPTDNIAEGKDVVAGPFHPAFRELVDGYKISKDLKEKLKENKEGTIIINNRDISKLYANKKMFFNKLLNEGYKINVLMCDKVKRGEFIIKSGEINEKEDKR